MTGKEFLFGLKFGNFRDTPCTLSLARPERDSAKRSRGRCVDRYRSFQFRKGTDPLAETEPLGVAIGDRKLIRNGGSWEYNMGAFSTSKPDDSSRIPWDFLCNLLYKRCADARAIRLQRK